MLSCSKNDDNKLNLEFPKEVELSKSNKGSLKVDLSLSPEDSLNLIKRITFFYLSTEIDTGEINRHRIMATNNKRAYSDTTGTVDVFDFDISFNRKGPQKLSICFEDVLVVKNESAPMKMSIHTMEHSGQMIVNVIE